MGLYSELEKGNSVRRNFIVIGWVSDPDVKFIVEMAVAPTLIGHETLHFMECDDNPNRFEVRVRYRSCPPTQERRMRWIYFIKGLVRGWQHFRPKPPKE